MATVVLAETCMFCRVSRPKQGVSSAQDSQRGREGGGEERVAPSVVRTRASQALLFLVAAPSPDSPTLVRTRGVGKTHFPATFFGRPISNFSPGLSTNCIMLAISRGTLRTISSRPPPDFLKTRTRARNRPTHTRRVMLRCLRRRRNRKQEVGLHHATSEAPTFLNVICDADDAVQTSVSASVA